MKLVFAIVLALLIGASIAAQATVLGVFNIIDIRRASDVAGRPADKSLTWELGQTVSFHETLTLPNAKTCLSWAALPSEDPVVNQQDPILSDTQIGPIDSTRSVGDRTLNQHIRIRCDGEDHLSLLQVDERVLVGASPSGESYVIFEKPLNPSQLKTLQSQLKRMKYLEEEPTGAWTEATQSAVGQYAEYRGASYKFHRAALTANLLDGLKVLSRTPEGVVNILYAGDIAVYYYGEAVDMGPPEYGTTEIRFRFRGDEREYPFKPTGKLEFSDWSLELFSPNGRYVALLQDHYGPYHVLSRTHLKDYLKGNREPDWTVAKPGMGDPGYQRAVHSDLWWTTPTSLEFSHTCCGDPIGQFWQVPDDKYPLTCTRDTVALYRPSLSSEIDAIPRLPAQTSGLAGSIEKVAADTEFLDNAYYRLSRANATAAESPGAWGRGQVESGANINQYRPSDAELIGCVTGRELLDWLDGRTYSNIAKNWHGRAEMPLEIRFRDIRFRRTEVAGSGLFWIPSEPRPVIFGPWRHGPKRP